MKIVKQLRSIAITIQAIGMFFSLLLYCAKHKSLALLLSVFTTTAGLTCLHRATVQEQLCAKDVYQAPTNFDIADNEPWETQTE